MGEILASGYLEVKRRYVCRFERRILERLLEHYNWNLSRMARDIKMDRSNLLRLLKSNGFYRVGEAARSV